MDGNFLGVQWENLFKALISGCHKNQKAALFQARPFGFPEPKPYIPKI